MLRQAYEGLLHWIYPRVCWLCQQFLGPGHDALCVSCQSAITNDPVPTCPRCASTVGPHVYLDDACVRCRGQVLHFERTFRMGPYEGLLRDAILRMKQPGGESFAEVIGAIWAKRLAPRLHEFKVGLGVPIPIHWTRRWRRTYNQGDVLARHLARELSVPCRPNVLKRIRRTSQQTQQPTPAARHDNVRGAFRVHEGLNLSGTTVLLVDDVFTTGSTASEASRALKAVRPAHILVAVLAHGL